MERKTQKKNSFKGFIRKSELLIELLILTLIYFWVWRFFYRGTSFPYYGRGKYVLMGIYAMLTLVLFTMNESNRFGYMKLSETIISQCISIFIVDLITFFQLSLIANVTVDFVPIMFLMLVDFVICTIFTFLFTRLYLGTFAPKKLIMIYGNDNAVNLKFKMDERAEKYNVETVMCVEEGIDKITSILSDYDGVIINDVCSDTRNDLLKYCYAHSIETYLVPKISDVIIRGANEITLFDTPIICVEAKGLSHSQAIIKRSIDLFLAIVTLIPGLPIMGLIAIAIKINDKGPVFFRQKRVTINGREFEILKFRSMVTDAEDPEKYKNLKATDNDPRITKVGRFLRATRLDELPQIFNILKNDMSFVGPRPERIEHVKEYEKELPEFVFRSKVKGGLTGYAQIYGKYNTSAYDKLRLDLKYIEDYSLLLDLKLMFMTLQIMLRPESTEGFDKSEELELKKKQLLEDMNSSKED